MRRRRPIEEFRTDLRAWALHGWGPPGGRFTGLRLLAALVRFPGLRATLIYRFAHAASRAGIPFVPTLLTQLNVALHGIELPPAVPIGPGLYLPHTVGSVITARRIGAGVTLQGGITLGMRRGGDFPTLDDGVVVGAGARVIGDVRIGAGATVGAGAVVLQDVPAGATVVGPLARVLSDPPAGVNGESVSLPSGE